MDLIKVVVVGVGSLGSRHARIYSELPGVELVGVLDTDQNRTEEIAAQYNCHPFTGLEDIPSSVEAISVVVPTDRHYEVAEIGRASCRERV